MDAKPLRGLELGLVVVADAAFGHQPRRLERQVLAAFAGPGLRMGVRVDPGMRAGVVHRASPVRPAPTVPEQGRQRTSGLRAAVALAADIDQKMSNASSSGCASWSGIASSSSWMRSWSSTFSHSTTPFALTSTIPAGGSRSRGGSSFSAVFM